MNRSHPSSSAPIIARGSKPVLRVLAVVATVLLLAACATRGSAGRDAAALERFEAAAGEPVDSFRFVHLQGFSTLGDEHIAIWTRPREAFLLRVDGPCSDLGWTPFIGLSSSLGRVHVRFDRLHVGRDRCRIAEIRPIDVAVLRESERSARSDAIEARARDAETLP